MDKIVVQTLKPMNCPLWTVHNCVLPIYFNINVIKSSIYIYIYIKQK